ncbi:MAG TPA: SUMF1/EgtB/PvdO family nonheme iron enzyme [Planctomycetota bacterium]|jgi:formylglycine-generating enzyme required for sulfatase activity
MKSLTYRVLFPALLTFGVVCSAALAGQAPVTATPASLRLAVRDLMDTHGARYPNGAKYLAQLDEIEKALQGKDKAPAQAALATLQREALLANPLLDFGKLLLVKRGEKSPRGLPQNWEGNEALPKSGYDNEIDVLSPVNPDGTLTTLYKPEGTPYVGDMCLDYDAEKLMFSMSGNKGAPAGSPGVSRWQIYEVKTDGAGLRQLPLISQPDVDNYSSCYLPDGNIIFTSTAPFTGVPCVTGASHVANIYRLETQTGAIRRLTFEQEHNWCPTMLPNGQVLYLRWEYSDIPHYVARILFHMNPDGTNQQEHYGSNSYWPNAMFFAKPVPGSATKFVAIIGGHHDVPRMGELILFDTAKSRREADGVVQRIPGYGKPVVPLIRDNLVSGSWPKFLHPYPLSDKYFLASAQLSGSSKWGIYLVDVFDNLTLIKECPGYVLFEPIPLRKTVRPPVVPSGVVADRKDALVHIADIYAGEGLKGVPRGSVKKLRLFTYHFAYHGMGGQVNRVGLDGPWDVKQIIGTVPVEPDGSAFFRVPANTPLSMQPLDAEGNALQLMRSWMTAMPGELVSCVGCHEQQHNVPQQKTMQASYSSPADITPWYGPTRGFSFSREVQQVLDKHCVSCHDGKPSPKPLPAGITMPDFTARPPVHPEARDKGYNNGTQFTPSYMALRAFLRTPTIESDMHILTPSEYHANTTALFQLLEKGHYGVKLDAESRDRLVTWFDLNTPAHGTWGDIIGEKRVTQQRDRRREMLKLYAGRDEDPEAIPVNEERRAPSPAEPRAVAPVAPTSAPLVPAIPGWPFDAAEAAKRQSALGEFTREIEISPTLKLKLVRIPAGEFVMGATDGFADEQPAAAVKIASPYWMSTLEISNEQYACFDALHDSKIERGDFLQFSEQERGFPANGPKQPAVRVSWREAMDFCRWISTKTGLKFTLPTEAQWEYACRAGTATPMNYGALDADFSTLANLADVSLRRMPTLGWGLPSGAVPEWRPAITTVDDKNRVSAPVGTYKPNAWGLSDMHGNVAEWTLSSYRPYPYRDDDGRNDPSEGGAGLRAGRVVRGGSWWDRPYYARSAYRLAYPAWQRVYNVGFRVICEEK